MSSNLRTRTFISAVACVAAALALIGVTTNAGIQGCGRGWLVPAIAGLSLFASGVYEMVLSVPLCNGLAGYLVVLAVGLVTSRSSDATAALLVLYAVLEGGYRRLVLGDGQWAVLMPFWNVASSFVLLLALAFARYLVRIALKALATGTSTSAPK